MVPFSLQIHSHIYTHTHSRCAGRLSMLLSQHDFMPAHWLVSARTTPDGDRTLPMADVCGMCAPCILQQLRKITCTLTAHRWNENVMNLIRSVSSLIYTLYGFIAIFSCAHFSFDSYMRCAFAFDGMVLDMARQQFCLEIFFGRFAAFVQNQWRYDLNQNRKHSFEFRWDHVTQNSCRRSAEVYSK